MFTITRDFEFCYGHRLLGHHGKCCHLHGHNATLRVTLAENELAENGMVRDFGQLKETVSAWLETQIDHTLLLWENDPLTHILREQNERFLPLPFHPTAENLARFIYENLTACGISLQEVRLWETPHCCACYSRDC